MSEPIRGDVLTKKEMKQRGIYLLAGDRGGIEFRSIHSTNILLCEQLLADGFIENYHLWDAMVFMDLRRAFEALMGVKWVKIDIQPQEGQLTTGDACKLYDAIRHQMGVKRAGYVVNIITDSFQPVKQVRAEIKDVYRKAFEELSCAMEEVDKRRDELLA